MTMRLADAIARSRMWALVALGAGIAAQLVWFVVVVPGREPSATYLARPVIFTVVMGLLLLTRGRTAFPVLLARLLIGGTFLDALWGRFDNFSGFIAYTAKVNAFLPLEVIPSIAITATALECVLCVAMLLGISTSLTAAASAVLLFLFATAMEISGLDQFEWAVYVLAAGSWVVAASKPRLLSVDALMSHRHARRQAGT